VSDVRLPILWPRRCDALPRQLGATLSLTAGTLVASIVLERQVFADYAFAAGLASVMAVGFEWFARSPLPSTPSSSGAFGDGCMGGAIHRFDVARAGIVLGCGARGSRLLASLPTCARVPAWSVAGLPFVGSCACARPLSAARWAPGLVLQAGWRRGLPGRSCCGCGVGRGRSASWIAAGWAVGFAGLGSIVWLLVARAGKLRALRADTILVVSAVAASLGFATFHSLPNRAVAWRPTLRWQRWGSSWRAASWRFEEPEV